MNWWGLYSVLIVVAAMLMFTFLFPIYADTYIKVNNITCLTTDAYDRQYVKNDCYIKLNEDNIKDFCKINKSVDQEWCDPEVMNDLLSERKIEK